MHTKPMADSDGVFSSPEQEKYICRQPECGKKEVICEKWESSCGGYEDYRYTCQACKHGWWVEGIDS